jgi:hypothetical protein
MTETIYPETCRIETKRIGSGALNSLGDQERKRRKTLRAGSTTYQQWAATAALSLAISAVVLLGLPAQVGAARLPFKPGFYTGTTSQKCTPSAAAEDFCQAGERLPVSFTLTRNKVSHVKALVIEKCEKHISTLNYIMDYPRALRMGVKPKRAVFYARNSIIKDSASLTNDLLAGYVKGMSAHGVLESLMAINAEGQIDANGDAYCSARGVHWQATRKAG